MARLGRIQQVALGQLCTQMHMNEAGTLSHTICQNLSKWINNLHTGAKTGNILRKKHRDKASQP